MKKILTLAVGALTAFSAAFSSSTAYAENKVCSISVYFRGQENDSISVVSDELILVDKGALQNGDITVNIGAYIKDDSKELCTFSLKWRCESDYITLGNIVDPTISLGETKNYTTSSGTAFSTDLTPFPFALITDGVMEIVGTPIIVNESEINSAAFSYMPQKYQVGRPFSYLGETSDEYPFTYFDAVINSETPVGEYEIFYATAENTEHEEGDSRNYSQCLTVDSTNLAAMKTSVVYPETQSVTICVTDGNLLGDADMDGTVDAYDASLVLKEYANASTGNPVDFSAYQKYLSDVDKNGVFDSSDSSIILSYYAFISTGGSGTLEDFLGN